MGYVQVTGGGEGRNSWGRRGQEQLGEEERAGGGEGRE